jgi:hypothetical protein
MQQLKKKDNFMFNQLLELGLPLVSFKDFDPSQILSVLGRRNKKYLLLNPALQQRSLKLFLSLLSKLCSSFKDVVIVVNYKDSTFIDNLKVTLNKNSKVSIVYSSEINLLNKILKQHSLSSTLVISLFINDKTELRHIFIESSKYNLPVFCLGNSRLNKEFGLFQVIGNFNTKRSQMFALTMVFLSLKKRNKC